MKDYEKLNQEFKDYQNKMKNSKVVIKNLEEFLEKVNELYDTEYREQGGTAGSDSFGYALAELILDNYMEE